MHKLVLGFGLILILNLTSGEDSNDDKNEAESKDRIIDGEIAKPKQFPYLGYTVSKINGSIDYDKLWCSVIIVSEGWVLTVASCADKFKDQKGNVFYDFQIVVGVTDRDDPNIKNTRQVVNVSDIIFHPQWNRDPLKLVYGDIALFKVDPQFVFNDHVQKVKLFGSPRDPLNYGEICTFAGFGSDKYPEAGKNYVSSRKKRFRNLTYVSKSECKDVIKRQLHLDTICAVDKKGLGGLCYYDGGAGLLCKDKLVGLATYLINPCEKKMPTVFTDIRPFQPWIKYILNSRCCPVFSKLTSGSKRLNYSLYTFILQSSILVLLIAT